MLKNIDQNTLAAVVSKAVVAALAELTTPEPVAQPTRLSATVSQNEFAEETGLGINTVAALIRSNRIRHVRVGVRNVRIPRAEIEAFLEREAQGGEK
jgi:excisionase family DNA binding protein